MPDARTLLVDNMIWFLQEDDNHSALKIVLRLERCVPWFKRRARGVKRWGEEILPSIENHFEKTCFLSLPGTKKIHILNGSD